MGRIKWHWGREFKGPGSISFLGGAVTRDIRRMFGITIGAAFFGFMQVSADHYDTRRATTKKSEAKSP